MTELSTFSYPTTQIVFADVLKQLYKVDDTLEEARSIATESPESIFGTSYIDSLCSLFTSLLEHVNSKASPSSQDINLEIVKAEFEKLADKWEQEVKFISSVDDMIAKQSYQDIIKMGQKVIPILIEDMKKTRRPWFFALHILTNENPVKKEHCGIITEVINDWVEWGQNKYF